MTKKIFWSIAALLLVAAVAGYVWTRPERLDTRYTGAYALDDQSFIYITPDGDERLRYRTLSGQSGALWPSGNHRFSGGKGWDDREPSFNTFSFEMDADGHPSALIWEQPGVAAIHAPRVKLTEQFTTFKSGDLTLRGKLVRPTRTGPHPAVVIVHGSEDFSAVDRYFEPYLYASAGFAALVFDKRGTGESQGKYTQNFGVLADDVIAAVQWLREQPNMDNSRIHLAGFSQGGWIAPLAAAKDKHIRSVLIGFGPMVPVRAEDRWGYVYALHQKGFGDDAIANADRIDAVMSDIVDHRQDRWSELGKMLEASRHEPWFEAVKGSDSMLGFIAATRLPLWVVRLGLWWKVGRDNPPFIDRLYDPVPTAAALKAPSFWIFGGEDSSMPTQWTIDELNKLQKRGKPVDYMVYPDADHGILRVEKQPNGKHRVLGYEPDYFKLQLDWLRRSGGSQQAANE